tara:strand:- start:93 stop:293 length:201 start_codon:yes stop_codon:yes gene_type:complete
MSRKVANIYRPKTKTISENKLLQKEISEKLKSINKNKIKEKEKLEKELEFIRREKKILEQIRACRN